jgi:hypothetical protein
MLNSIQTFSLQGKNLRFLCRSNLLSTIRTISRTSTLIIINLGFTIGIIIGWAATYYFQLKWELGPPAGECRIWCIFIHLCRAMQGVFLIEAMCPLSGQNGE